MKWKHLILFIAIIITLVLAIVWGEYSSILLALIIGAILINDALGIQDEDINMIKGTTYKLYDKINYLQKQIDELKAK